MENYAVIFSVDTEQEKLLSIIKEQNNILTKLCEEIHEFKKIKK